MLSKKSMYCAALSTLILQGACVMVAQRPLKVGLEEKRQCDRRVVELSAMEEALSEDLSVLNKRVLENGMTSSNIPYINILKYNLGKAMEKCITYSPEECYSAHRALAEMYNQHVHSHSKDLLDGEHKYWGIRQLLADRVQKTANEQA